MSSSKTSGRKTKPIKAESLNVTKKSTVINETKGVKTKSRSVTVSETKEKLKSEPVPTDNALKIDKLLGKRSKTKQKVSSNWDQINSQLVGAKRAREESSDNNPAKRQKTSTFDQKIQPSSLSVNNDTSLTKYLALDCEMVGVGPEGAESVLARVVFINSFGNVVFDKYVKPQEDVVDYRTAISGILPEHLENAPSFEEVQKEVAALIKDRIIVGHGLENDFRALLLSHPFTMTRDTSKYRPLQRKKNAPHSLKWLAKNHLNMDIQVGQHNPDVDARAALLIYNKYKKDWEASLKKIRKPKKVIKKKPAK